MQSFVVKVLVWVTGLVIFATASSTWNSFLMRYHGIDQADEVRVLIGGDSHAVAALDPQFLELARNVGLSSEPLAATFFKIKFLAKQAPDLEKIIVTLGPHNIAPYQDLRFGQRRADYLFRSLYGVVPFSDIEGMPHSSQELFASHLGTWWTPNIHLLGDWIAALRGEPDRTHNHSEGYGGNWPTSLTDEFFNSVIDRHFPDSLPGVSRVQLGYLSALVSWATGENIELILVRTPLHERYREAVPPNISSTLDSVWVSLAATENVQLIDFSKMSLPDSAYLDYDHLDTLGAYAVGQALRERLGQHPPR